MKKYRAWDEDNEIMYYSDKEYEDCFFGFDKGAVVAWLRQTEPETRDEHAYDYGKPIGVMQFTGLCDENGKEIYEGDIVQFEYYDDDLKGLKSKGQVFWNNASHAWGLKHKGKLYVSLEGYHNYEIIGNIHQPELLEEQ